MSSGYKRRYSKFECPQPYEKNRQYKIYIKSICARRRVVRTERKKIKSTCNFTEDYESIIMLFYIGVSIFSLSRDVSVFIFFFSFILFLIKIIMSWG